MRVDRDVVKAWCAARGATARWGTGVALGWAALALFARVTIPLVYPFEARGTVVSSGVVVGLVVPLVLMTSVLDDGPSDLVVPASRSLVRIRAVLATVFVGLVGIAAMAVAATAEVPLLVVFTDAVTLAGLILVGVALLGGRVGWLLATVVVTAFTVPGLVPWELNVAYQREVRAEYFMAAASICLAGLAAYATWGAAHRRRCWCIVRA